MKSQSFRLRNLKQHPQTITEGSITKSLLMFFFPILFGTFFQQLYNTIDAIIVGRFVGKQALAAVGGGSSVFVNLIVGFFMGLSSGAGVTISQFYGSKNKTELSRSVHTALAMSISGGLIMTIAGISLAYPILKVTKTPEDVFNGSLIYLRIYFCAMIPLFIYNMGSGILRAVGDSLSPLLVLIAGCFTNIFLDLLFVVKLGMGVSGAAIATGICQIESALIVLLILTRRNSDYKVSIKNIKHTPHILSVILKIGFPAGIQSSLYTISNLIIQTNINSFGTDTAAAWAAFGKIDAIFWMTVSAFGIAITTFSGQNYGAGKMERIKKAVWITLAMATGTTIAMCILFRIFNTPIFKLFATDPSVIKKGTSILLFLMPFWLTYISIEILSGTIRGCGVSFEPMIITVFGVCGLRLLWIFIAVPFHRSLFTVLACYPITWIATSIAFWIFYFSGKWLKNKKEKAEQIKN